METKAHFFKKKNCNISKKIGYCNTKFVSLQYKNTNDIYKKKYTEKSQVFLKDFFWNF